METAERNDLSREKLPFLDGIRGLMALNVVICHFVLAYYPQMYMVEKDTGGGLLRYFARTPLSILVNGDIAVRYFLVLTGFLVGRKFLTGKEPDRALIVKKSIDRYLRLMPVIFAATLFTHLTMVLGLQHHWDIMDLVAYSDNLALQCNFAPTLRRLLLNGLYEPFVLGGSDYIGAFWMLRFELWGYILSMLTCYFLRDSKMRRIGYIVIGLLLWITVDENYLGFFFGIFVADLCYRKGEHSTWLSRFYEPLLQKRTVIWILALIGGYLATCPMEFVGIHAPLARIPKITTYTPRAVGVAVLLYCLLQSPSCAKLFEGPILRFLGKISYSIYAFHTPLMLSMEAGLFGYFYGRMSYDSAALLAFGLTIPVILLVAYGGYLLVEKNRFWSIKRYLEKIPTR